MNLKEKAKSLILSAKKYWKTPPQGRYMSYKEILSLSVGGIGVKFIVYCVNNMILSSGNTLIGNTIGIGPTPMYVIYLLGVLSGFPLTALRAKMIDNTRSMKGKYRPYIISMGIPTVLLGIGFISMPYEGMTLMTKCVTVLLFNVGFQFFFNFMNDAYDSLINVLSPNTLERSDVCSIKAIIENLSPSIANIFLPIAARIITGDNTLYNLRVYRVLYPPMLVAGFLISVIVYVNTEEKIVQAKTHFVQIKFADAFRAVARNKYFWIISLAGWLGFLEGSFNSILGWMYNYRSACTAGQYSLIVAIAGNASFWPNIVAPYIIRRYGKRKILIFTNLLNIAFIILMLPIVRMTDSGGIIWLLLACNFVNQFITSLGHLMNPSLNADIRDYQQYITGERIDGMFAAVGLIGNVITLSGGFIMPLLSKNAGLNESVALSLGFDGSNVYNVLYDEGYFVRICSVLVIASVFGAVMNVIPYFFYDLTEIKQRAIVTVLRIRAFFEDYGNGTLTDKDLIETVDIINEAKEFAEKTPAALSNEGIKAAKKSGDKAAVKSSKAELKRQRSENEKIEIAKAVLGELNRFGTPEGVAEIENARRIVENGLKNLYQLETTTVKQAKQLPKSTPDEKAKRNAAVSEARKIITAQRTAKKYYPEGIDEFDSAVFEKLFAAEDENERAIYTALQNMKRKKEEGDRAAVAELKSELAFLGRQKNSIKSEIKRATRQNTIYNRSAKPYLDAKRLMLQQENYSHYDLITAQYDSAKERLEQKLQAANT